MDMIIKDHISEKEIELYILNSPTVAEERSKIENHISHCKGCKEIYEEISGYYIDLEKDFAASENLPVVKPIESPVFSKSKLQREHWEYITERVTDLPFPYRLARWIMKHPYVASASTIGFTSIVIGILMFLFQPFDIKLTDMNPDYARAEKEFLTVYNKSGELLWKKHIGIGFDWETTLKDGSVSLENILTAIDVDNDGEKEIITTFGWGNFMFPSNTIICFDSDSTIKWKYDFTCDIESINKKYSNDFSITRILSDDFNNDKTVEIIALVSHKPFEPNAVIKLDASTGNKIAEYWHPGFLRVINAIDIDYDGKKEILIGGENNKYNLASLIIFDSEVIDGNAPTLKRDQVYTDKKGTEKYYLLLPRLDIGKFSIRGRNIVREIARRDFKIIQIGSDEEIEISKYIGISYYFNYDLIPQDIHFSDVYITYHKNIENQGKSSTKLDEIYKENLKNGVLYWNGKNFVTKKSINENYINLKK